MSDDHHHHHHHDGGASPSDAESWDERYRDSDRLWSGSPNAALVDEVADLPPGRAVDLACGEGADAIWLAERGWSVVAIDISSVAIDRARAAAVVREVTVEWVASDFTEDPPIGPPADLVVSFYPAIPADRRDAAIAALTGCVADGGTLLVVHHDFTDADDLPFDPADYVSVGDVAAALADGWEIEFHGIRDRTAPHGGASPAVPDEVLRARRTG